MSIFNSIRVKKPKRTAFDLSHEVKFSWNFGQLIPFMCQEVLPGDTFKVSSENLVRFAPLIAPIMHRVNVYTHYFYVPNRLVWDEWKDFITGGDDGTATPVFPRIKFAGVNTPGTLADYLGCPCWDDKTPPSGNTNTHSMLVSALPFRAYQLIWNEYYRDQNLQAPIDIDMSSGISNKYIGDNINRILHRCWEKDYFTSALPYPQRLPNPVTLPIGVEAPVKYRGDDPDVGPGLYRFNTDQNGEWQKGEATFFPGGLGGEPGKTATLRGVQGNIPPGNVSDQYPTNYDPNGTLYTDLTETTGVSINELRRGFSLQKWLENNARGGARYIKQLLVHFGVRSSDARLQRPEYLGGGKTPVVVSEVQQTSETATSPQGNLAGNATSYGRSHSFKRFFEEHGMVIGIMSVMPRTAYQNGLPRMFAKFDKFDYYWPEFAHLGEQEIKRQELFYDFSNAAVGDNGENYALFGYTPRYAEYRFVNSHVHGDFRSTLNFWHLGRIFDSMPGLNGQFVTCGDTKDPKGGKGLNRIFAVDTDTDGNNVDHLWVQMYVNFKALRPLPKYGTPGL